MVKHKYPNQVNKPQKGQRIDTTWKLYFKHDGCSMLLFDHLTAWQASNRRHVLSTFFSDWKGKFIVTK